VAKHIVALVDDAHFQQRIERAAAQLGYAVTYADAASAADVVAYLVERQPGLIVVGLKLTALDWERWVITMKSSPATRKMPVLAFGPPKDMALLERARRAGCDAAVGSDAFTSDVAGHITQYARADESAAIAAAARLPLPALAQKAIEQFNAGEYWEQHETFETVWRAEPGPIRQLYQGILQVGVAYLQIQRKNYIGARKLFQRARQYLTVLPDVCQGVDIAQLRADAQAAQAELERLGADRVGEFPAEMMRPVRLLDH
jgi:uncharacterized protein